MSTTEAGSKITDTVEAALVECAPQPEPEVLSIDVSLPTAHDAPPVVAQDATIEHTGADPPPAEAR